MEIAGFVRSRRSQQAGAMVIERVRAKEFVGPFHPTDPRIKVWEDDPASTQPAEPLPRAGRPRPITAAPPGYGDERTIAVVVLSFAWSIHSGDATYVLRYDGKQWKVISRHFAYYL
jgi:hypothetical protein